MAVGQTFTYTSHPVSVLETQKSFFWNQIKDIIFQWKPRKIIVGYPLNMDGTENLLSIKTKEFAKKIKKFFKHEIILHDERLTSFEARCRLLNFCKKKNIQKKIHQESASIIIESWFLKCISLKKSNL